MQKIQYQRSPLVLSKKVLKATMRNAFTMMINSVSILMRSLMISTIQSAITVKTLKNGMHSLTKKCRPRITVPMNSLTGISMNTVNTWKMGFMKIPSDVMTVITKIKKWYVLYRVDSDFNTLYSLKIWIFLTGIKD